MTLGRIEVSGMREFRRALKQMDADLPKQVRLTLNDCAQLVIDYAAPRMPTRTGRARGSLKARSTQTAARIAMGGRRAPYAPWLDFGGEGRVQGRPPARPYIKGGRYVYPGLEANRSKITERMSAGLTAVATAAGLEVT